MGESAQVRKQGAFDFDTHYTNLCVLQNDCPLPVVRSRLSQGILDLNGDQIRAVDWVPILNTLRINRNLQKVAVRSFYRSQSTESAQIPYGKRKIPSLRSKEITYRLSRAIKECLGVTSVLTAVELQGLPLRERDLYSITKGIMKNSSVREFSVEKCRIADTGIEILCRGLNSAKGIHVVNFSGCGITWRGTDILAQLIKHQAMTRHSEAWRDSLRYRQPDLDRMSGIRRVSINDNPLIGDQGVSLLAEVLKDDLWLKALDLQGCGVTSSGAQSCLDVLKFNTTLVVLDLRRNPLIGPPLLHSVSEQLLLNSNGQDTEYKWLGLPSEAEPRPKPIQRRRHTKTVNCAIGRKSLKASSNIRRRTRSSGAPPLSSSNNCGYGWRTAARANRLKGCPPNLSSTGSFDDVSTDSAGSRTGHRCSDPKTRSEPNDTTTLHKPRDSKDMEERRKIASLQVENAILEQKLKSELEARTKADARVVELMVEVSELRNALAEKKTGSLLDDDQVLDNIESAFEQFHSFLDLLENFGLGDLASLAFKDKSTILGSIYHKAPFDHIPVYSAINQTVVPQTSVPTIYSNGSNNSLAKTRHTDKNLLKTKLPSNKPSDQLQNVVDVPATENFMNKNTPNNLDFTTKFFSNSYFDTANLSDIAKTGDVDFTGASHAVEQNESSFNQSRTFEGDSVDELGAGDDRIINNPMDSINTESIQEQLGISGEGLAPELSHLSSINFLLGDEKDDDL